MKNLIFSGWVILIFVTISFSYAQSERISNASWGIDFERPAGWTYQEIQSGYLLVSDNGTGIMLVTAHHDTSLEQLRSGALEGMNDGSGTMLYPVESVQPFGPNGILAEYTGAIQNTEVKAVAVGLLSPYSGGVTVLAATDPGTASTTTSASRAGQPPGG